MPGAAAAVPLPDLPEPPTEIQEALLTAQGLRDGVTVCPGYWLGGNGDGTLTRVVVFVNVGLETDESSDGASALVGVWGDQSSSSPRAFANAGYWDPRYGCAIP